MSEFFTTYILYSQLTIGRYSVAAVCIMPLFSISPADHDNIFEQVLLYLFFFFCIRLLAVSSIGSLHVAFHVIYLNLNGYVEGAEV